MTVLVPAQAEVAPADARDHLSILIAGHITPKCTLDRRGSESVSLGEILDPHTGAAAQATANLSFHIQCNAPYIARPQR